MNLFLKRENKDGIRMPWNRIPLTTKEAKRCLVPISAIYTPLKDMPSSTPLLPYPPNRCSRCQAVLNPFSQVNFSTNSWNCSFCHFTNQLPTGINNNNNNIHPQVLPQNTTIEYEIPNSGDLLPHIFLFVIDTCLSVEEFGHLKALLSEAMDGIPDNSIIGFIRFGDHVDVFELGRCGSTPLWAFGAHDKICKNLVYKGMGLYVQKNISLDNVIPGVSNFSEHRTIRRFFLTASESRVIIPEMLDREWLCWHVEARRRSSPRVFLDNQRPPNCIGTALSVAAELLGICFPGSPARIMAFVGSPATEGPGAIVSRELSVPIRSHTDITNRSAPYYAKAIKFYQGLSEQLIHQGHMLDVFACAVDQVGVAEMKLAVERSGGLLVVAESFGSSTVKDSLEHIFRSGVSICTFEMSCSKNIKIQRIVGPGALLEKKGPLHSDMDIGQRNTMAWRMSCVDKSTSLCLLFEIANNYSPHAIAPSEDNQFLLQFLTCYQHDSGNMRLRATTISRRCARPGNIKDLIDGFDQEAAAVVTARQVISKMETEAKFEPIRWLESTLIHLSSRFGDYQKKDPSSFSFCTRFSLLPPLIFHLCHSVQTFNRSPDQTAYFRIMIKCQNVSNTVLMIKPSLLAYSIQDYRVPVALDMAVISPDRILVMDSYVHIIIWHGSTIVQLRENAGQHDHTDQEALAQLLRQPQDDAYSIIKERFPVPLLVICDQNSSQARYLLARLNPFVDAPRYGRPVRRGIIFTTDLSFELFWDQIQMSAVGSGGFFANMCRIMCCFRYFMF